MDQIVAKTDGVPLFVEELTKTVLEAGFLKARGGRYELDGPLPPLAIPSTLRDSLMARLDRLSHVKEVAQVGACIGREFSHELLAAVSPLRDDKLQEAFRQLVNSQLIVRRGTPPEATYSFKHALVQDAAYDSLLKRKRQELHERISRTLEEKFPDIAESEPEFMAQHCTKAMLADQAIAYWLKAGRRATERSANVEAISHLGAGLKILAGQPQSATRHRRELELQLALGTPLMATRGYTAEETAEAYARARALCAQLDNPPELFRVLYGLFAYRWVRAELAEARDAAEDFLHVAQDQGNRAAEVVAERVVGAIHAASAEFTLACDHLERTLTLYTPQAHSSLAFEYAQDPAVTALAYLSTTLWMLGFPEQARDKMNDAERYARELAHPHTLVYLLMCGASWLQMFLRDSVTTRTHATESISIATEQAFPYWSAYAKIVGGWATAHQDESRAGVAAIAAGLRQYRSMGSALFLPMFLWALADAHRMAGDADEGLTAIRDGLAAAEGSGELWWHAELHR